ncbi:MAG: VOC family protein [Acidiferrobacterales bacterium]
MPIDKKVDYIELPARDLDAAQAFYEAVFNWHFTDYGPDYRAFTDGKVDGGFYRSDKHSLSETGAALVIFYAANLESVQDAILAAGGKILKEIFDFPGGRRFQFTDPNGNELAVWSDK